MAVITLALGCALAVAAAVLITRWTRSYLEFHRLQMAIPGKPSLPLLGHALHLLSYSEETAWAKAQELWGGRTELTRVTLLNRLLVFVTDPNDLAALVRRKDFNDKSRFFYEFIDSLAPKGIVVVNGAEWKMHRMATQPAFHTEVLDSFAETFAEEAEKFVSRLVPGQEKNLHEDLYQTTASAFVRTAMTSEVRPGTERVLVDVLSFLQQFLRVLNDRSLKPWLWFDCIFNMTSASKRTQEGVARIHEFLRGIMKERRAKLAAVTRDDEFLKRRKTLLDVLLDAQGDGKSQLTDNDILDQMIIFIGAAVETSTSTLSSALKLLSFHPDVQEKLYAEVSQVLGDSKRSVTLNDLPKMVYLERVIKETLRVLPAIPFVARQVHEKTEFAGKVLPAGTTLVLNIYGVHHDARHWPNPERFDPDRFTPEMVEARHPSAYMPFSAGNRNCIGYRYAMQLIKTTLATVVRDYRVDRAADGLTDHRQLHLTFDLALRMVGGARVVFTPRRSSVA